jgi:hypothetical protein
VDDQQCGYITKLRGGKKTLGLEGQSLNSMKLSLYL